MPNYHVEYETWNEYQYHVGESFFLFQILPDSNDKQNLNFFKFANSISEPFFITGNHYGFKQIAFRSLKPFTKLRIHLACEVHVREFNPFDFIQLAAHEENKVLSTLEFQIENGVFLQPSDFTFIPHDLIDEHWYKHDHETVFDFLCRLNAWIHSAFEYIPNITSVHDSARETYTTKKGVCQDFAHVFIAIAKLNKIPCRYVSGYLNQGKEFKGSLQMHAWAEAMVPNCGWIGFDPTNNVLQDLHYIKVCHGTDYSECGPIRGIIKGIGEQTTKYAVKVIQQ
jgi:hypothetical protein